MANSRELQRSEPDEDGLIHVFDLPQLYQKPSFDALSDALRLLSFSPESFGGNVQTLSTTRAQVSEEGVPKYLTNIIASTLDWIENEELKERLWELASERLSERSGRTAMREMMRTFTINAANTQFDIKLREPSITGDDLGLKTWGSAFALAQNLHRIKIPQLRVRDESEPRSVVLELGAGTGLVGLAAAAIWQTEVILTDLAAIEPNLAGNIEANRDTLDLYGGCARGGVLDWTDPNHLRLRTGSTNLLEHCSEDISATVILAADPIYSPEHPRLLVRTMLTWLQRADGARFILAYPDREAYEPQIRLLRDLLHQNGLEIVLEDTQVGRDDWVHDVTYCWSVWKWNPASSCTQTP